MGGVRASLGLAAMGKPPVWDESAPGRETLSPPSAVTGFPASLFLSVWLLEAEPDHELQRRAVAGEHFAVEGMTRLAVLPVEARFRFQFARGGLDEFAVAGEHGQAEALDRSRCAWWYPWDAG